MMLVLFLLWFGLSLSGLTQRAEIEISERLPAWMIWTNLIIGPCLWALAGGTYRLSPPIRLLFLALTFVSIVVLEICFRRYALPSCVALGVLVLEAYWIIPKWKSRGIGDGPIKPR